jgi:hypothetical protein
MLRRPPECVDLRKVQKWTLQSETQFNRPDWKLYLGG